MSIAISGTRHRQRKVGVYLSGGLIYAGSCMVFHGISKACNDRSTGRRSECIQRSMQIVRFLSRHVGGWRRCCRGSHLCGVGDVCEVSKKREVKSVCDARQELQSRSKLHNLNQFQFSIHKRVPAGFSPTDAALDTTSTGSRSSAEKDDSENAKCARGKGSMWQGSEWS